MRALFVFIVLYFAMACGGGGGSSNEESRGNANKQDLEIAPEPGVLYDPNEEAPPAAPI